jgi:hypothetical protein
MSWKKISPQFQARLTVYPNSELPLGQHFSMIVFPYQLTWSLSRRFPVIHRQPVNPSVPGFTTLPANPVFPGIIHHVGHHIERDKNRLKFPEYVHKGHGNIGRNEPARIGGSISFWKGRAVSHCDAASEEPSPAQRPKYTTSTHGWMRNRRLDESACEANNAAKKPDN